MPEGVRLERSITTCNRRIVDARPEEKPGAWSWSPKDDVSAPKLGYLGAQRRFETIAVALAVSLGLLLAARLAVRADDLPVIDGAFAVLAAYLAADFFSGFVHWFGDTWGTVEWPIVGNGLIRGFREHHVDPKAITSHDFVEASGAISVALVPVLALGVLVPCESKGEILAASFLLVFAVSLFATNEIHKWAHHDSVPPVVGRLQRARVILSPAHHALHHAAPYDGHYCITTGWLNPLLERADFFRMLERAITFATGAKPRAYDDDGFSPNTKT
jgi:ubiquitin-conjugating enzyme E2 variant